jgi:8-oxo-dGTP diphosphatase
VTRETAIGYVTQGNKLLVFRHTQFPEAGIQVPGGTVEPGESPRDAVLREVHEETGLTEIEVCAFLGECDLDLSPYGRDLVEKRHFFHLEFRGEAHETWLHYEQHPSDGSPAPIESEFYWVTLPEGIPELSGGQGEFLSRLPARCLARAPAETPPRSCHPSEGAR